MKSRMRITLDEVTRLGISLAEYVRRLVPRDLGAAKSVANPAAVFDLGASGGSDIARNKRAMIDEAFGQQKPNRHRG